MSNSNGSSIRTIALIAMLALSGILLGYGIKGIFGTGKGVKKESLSLDMFTTMLPQPLPLSEFSLVDHRGETFKLADFQKKWTFLFFGYISCPDVCPRTLDNLSGIYEILEKRGDLANTEVVFLSLDPARDTVKRLSEYVPYFNKNFTGVTGPEQEIEAFARQLGVGYTFAYPPESASDDDYVVNHSSAILLIDPLAREVARFSPPHRPETVVRDFLKIREAVNRSCCIP